MSMKIKFSYTEESEANLFIKLLSPIFHLFKVKKSTGTPPYNLIYFTPKNARKHDK